MPVNVAVRGFEELRQATKNVSERVMLQALKAAHQAAAAIVKQALISAAPRGKTGNLARSIITYEAKPVTRDYFNQAQPRTLIGPGSSQGFYGYFLEYGTKRMPAHEWARPAADSVDAEAMEAGKQAFIDVIAAAVK